jgi:multidrug resistance efflux pump
VPSIGVFELQVKFSQKEGSAKGSVSALVARLGSGVGNSNIRSETYVPLKQLIFRKTSMSVLFGLAVLAAFLLFSVTGHSRTKPQAATNAALTEVTVAEVIHRLLREWQEFSGRLQAVNSVEIRPRVSGFIDRVAFADGARVKKGQLLFQIDPRPFQAEVERLAAERTRSVSDLELDARLAGSGEGREPRPHGG